MKRTILFLALVASCGESAPTSTTTTGNGGGNTNGGGGTTLSCCINNQFYDCSASEAAYQACAGHDPSQCIRDASRDNTCGMGGGTDGGGGGGGDCSLALGGQACSFDFDCRASNHHCTGGKCYPNSAGNPCDLDGQCGSSHCTNHCCYPNGSGSPCDFTFQCGESSCVNHQCN